MMIKTKIKTNYIFVDESGKPEIYSIKGENLVKKGVASKYLVLAAVRSTNHLLLQQKINDNLTIQFYRFLIKSGITFYRFLLKTRNDKTPLLSFPRRRESI